MVNSVSSPVILVGRNMSNWSIWSRFNIFFHTNVHLSWVEGGEAGAGGGMMQHPMRPPGPPGGQPPTQSPMTAQMAPPVPPQQGAPPVPRQPGPVAPGAPMMSGPPGAVRPPGPPNNQQLLSQSCQAQQKQNRITSVPRPLGLDPLLILQERENRWDNNIPAFVNHFIPGVCIREF